MFKKQKEKESKQDKEKVDEVWKKKIIPKITMWNRGQKNER